MTTTKITTLFPDIDGVLLTNGWGRASRKSVAENFKLDFTEMDERHHLTFDTYESGKLGLDEYLNRVIFHEARPFSRGDFKTFMFIASCYVRLSKPAADIYHLAFDIANASPAGTLYIDDRLLFAEVARGLGLESIHHKAFETTKTALGTSGLSV